MTLLKIFYTACFLTVWTSQLSAAPLNHWRLDGTTADAVGSTPLTWSSTATYVSTVQAPGSTQAASLISGRHLRGGAGLNYDGASPFSACAWIKAASQDTTIMGDMVQGGNYTGWELHVGTNANNPNANTLNVWLINVYGSNYIQVNSPTVVLDNNWHFVAFTYDGSKSAVGVKIYVDGVDRTGTTAANSLTGTTANGTSAELCLGTRQNGAAHNFVGLIDEARLFSNVLTPAEISLLYTTNSLADVTPPTLAATDPASGETVVSMTQALVTFSENVTGVDAADLLVNGLPAASLVAVNAKQYRFTFAQPTSGTVNFSWAAGHGIKDTANNPFTGTGWSLNLNPAAPQNAQISEFLTDNSGGLEDEDHTTPDWIEISNPGPARLELGGWHLSDNLSNLGKWTFPATSVPAGTRLVVFASGKNRVASGAPLHTNFKLDGSLGSIVLTTPTGTTPAFSITYGQQPANVSQGLAVTAGLNPTAADWRYFTTPTPGAANSAESAAFGIALQGITSTPAQPQDADDILISASLAAAGQSFATPELRYRVMFSAGNVVSMHDDGLAGDAVAGDNIWSALIPASASSAGQMVRWQVTAARADGLVSRWPIYRAGLAAPEYLGTVISENGPVTQLPTYRVFAAGYTLPAGITPTAGSSLTAGAGYHAIDTDAGAPAALFYDGKLYDNVLFRIKGTTTRLYIKRSHRVDFNPGHYFKWSPTEPAQRELSLNSEFIDPSYSRQYLSCWLHRQTGTGAAIHFPVRLQMNGSFWQLAFHTYSLDEEMLDSMGLDSNGALYRQVGQLTSGAPEKQTRTWEDNTDYNDFASAISETKPLASRKLALFDQTDLPAVINDIVVMRLTQEADDVWANMGLHRDSLGTGEWRPMPFDMNLSFGQLFYDAQSWNAVVHGDNDANKSHPLYGGSAVLPQYPNNPAYNSWYNRLYDAVMRVPETRAMLLRRLRSIMDSTLGETAAASLLEGELNSLVARITAEAQIDRGQWGWPPTAGTFQAYGLGNVAFNQAVADLKNLYLAPRRTHLFTTHSIANTAKLSVDFTTATVANTANAQIPLAQTGIPALVFGSVESNPASGNQDEEFIEVRNPTSLAVDVSGWSIVGGVTHTFHPGTVIPASGSIWVTPNAAAFRNRATSPRGGENRFVQAAYKGHLDNRGEVLKLQTDFSFEVASITTPAAPSDAQRYLAISEIHYNPPGSTDATEFVEVLNLSNSVTVNLTGVHFSAGIDFTFPAGKTLAPGGRILVVKSVADFTAAYPTVPLAQIAGEFANLSSLDNGGERLKLDDSSNSTIVEFIYDDNAPWPTSPDGDGPSLVLMLPQAGDAYHSDPSHWRASTTPGGNPSGTDAMLLSGDPMADADHDGFTALLEYAFGTSEANPGDVSGILHFDAAGVPVLPEVPAGRDSAVLTLERSADMDVWVPQERGQPLPANSRWFVRARATLR